MDPCSLCHDLKIKYEGQVRLALDFTYNELQGVAALMNCKSCNIIWQAILQAEKNGAREWNFAEDVSRVYVYGLATALDTLSAQLYFKNDRPKLVLEIFHPEGGKLHTYIQPTKRNIYSCASPVGQGPWSAIKPKPSMKGHPLRQDSLAWVGTLLNKCVQTHPSCPSDDVAMLPRRILFLKRQTRSGGITIRLQEIDVPTKARYATLSHCWGRQQTCITTTGTLESHQKGIPWNEIPRTFQDSMSYCLKLHINYLWIDALCIIQDDLTDWQVESAKMADIYENSYITLAATISADDATGFYPQDVKNLGVEHPVPFCFSQKCPPILVREAAHHWSTTPSSASSHRFPLLSRGWVFQERSLSPRILHFCGQELVWECTWQTECECGGVDDSFKGTLQKSTLPVGTAQVEISSATSVKQLNLIPRDWKKLVRQYSMLQLTKDSDRLPALSGLAERISPFLKPYLAGLWEPTLEGDLLWKVNKLEPNDRLPLKYIAPSWSWASVASPVEYVKLYPSASEEFKVWKCEVQVAGKNPFGEVNFGRLVIHGRLREATVRWTFNRVGEWGKEWRTEHDKLRYEVHVHHNDRLGSVELPFFADYVLSVEGPSQVLDKSPVQLLEIRINLFLVLRESGTPREFGKTQEFRRIGLVEAPSAYRDLYGVDLMELDHSYLASVSII